MTMLAEPTESKEAKKTALLLPLAIGVKRGKRENDNDDLSTIK